MSTGPGNVNVCVVGGGHWGKNLIRNFQALGNLHSICESDPQRLDSYRNQYSVRFYPVLADALSDPDVNAVAIATPAEQHAAMTLAALRAGKDVFVEKPLALRWQDGVEMTSAARRGKRILMVGHLLLYHPAVLKIKEMLGRGELGRLEYIYSNRLSMGKIRREENALWSFAPHDISVILMLTGSLPLQVSALGGDVTVSNLLFDHGTRAHIFVSWLHPYKEQRLVVIGSKKMVVFEDSRAADKLVLYDKQIAWGNGDFEVKQPKPEAIALPPVEPLKAECQHFVDCVATRREPRTPGEDGVTVLQVLQSCQRSLQMNGEPVQVTEIGAQQLVAM
jgi:UDP-2-acetamido-3-amino-2,3-dideoxy-glucuronate N-acetyltransferase